MTEILTVLSAPKPTAMPTFFQPPPDDPETETDMIRRSVSEVMKGRQPPPKPNLDDYVDAVYDDPDHGRLFLARAGDRIIVQHPDPWIPTWVGRVQEVRYGDDDLGNRRGNVLAWDAARQQHAGTNYLAAPEAGVVIKLADERKIAAGKRKRGRPKGSKNRAKK